MVFFTWSHPVLITFSTLLLFLLGLLKSEDHWSFLSSIKSFTVALRLNYNIIHCTNAPKLVAFSSKFQRQESLNWILSNNILRGLPLPLILISFIPLHFMLFTFLCSLSFLTGSVIIFLRHIFKTLPLYLVYVSCLLSTGKKYFEYNRKRGY